MARRSLKPQLNQIRAWVHQGRTDAWIAHQLEISATELREFRKQYDLSPDDENAGSSEIDLRDEIEAEIEAAAAEQEQEEAEDADEAEDEDEDGEERRARTPRAAPTARRPPPTPAPPRPPRRARPAQRARGDLRPRRDRRLRPLARRRRSRTTPSTPSTGPASARSRSASRPTRSSSAAPAPPERRLGRVSTSPPDDERTAPTDEYATAVRLAQLAAAGEVAGPAQVEPEGGVGQRLRVALRRRGRRRCATCRHQSVPRP